MDYQNEPPSSRTPVEIWWKIIEDVFSTEDLFATTYDGDDWLRDAQKMRFTNIDRFKKVDEQRKILRAVCRTWRHLSDTVGRRFVPLTLYFDNEKSPSMDMDAIANTWRLYVGELTGVLPGLAGLTVEWRVLRINQEYAKYFEQVSHPHLRRLEIYLGESSVPYAPDHLLGSLKSFADITWLRYLTNTKAEHGHCLKDDGGEKITLPHLQVLYYYGYDALHFPYYRLILPSLRHLAIISEIKVKQLPLRQIIAAYGGTLYSLYVQPSPHHCGHPACDDLFPDDDPSYFPHWDQVPYLRDLSLGDSILLKYHPPPLDHPLRTFAAQICEINNICSWISNAESLKLIRMLRAARDDAGGVVRTDNGAMILNREGFEELEAEAASKGITLELISEPQDTK